MIRMIFRFSYVLRAYKRILSTHSETIGIDGMRLEHIQPKHLQRIHHQLNIGDSKISPIRTIRKRKSNGGFRNIGIYTMTDRVLLSTLAEKVAELYRPHFTDNVHSYIHRKGTHTALRMLAMQLTQPRIVGLAICDIKEAFDNVDLMSLVETLHSDNILPLRMRNMVIDIITDEGKKEFGLVQGNPLSPTLLNVYLHDLDLRMKDIPVYVRYSDNFIMGDSATSLSIDRYVNTAKSMLQVLNMTMTVQYEPAFHSIRWLGQTIKIH